MYDHWEDHMPGDDFK